jgi:hypothetical protein
MGSKDVEEKEGKGTLWKKMTRKRKGRRKTGTLSSTADNRHVAT